MDVKHCPAAKQNDNKITKLNMPVRICNPDPTAQPDL